MEGYKSRQGAFSWQSKQELCAFFTEKHQIPKERIDSEIEEVMKIFRLRQGQAINTLELWQKVGNNLLRELDEPENSGD